MIATVSKLPDEAAGRLLKTILAYVNDQNPEVEDLLLQIAFEPIKQQLKRDLVDWHDERQTRSESGRKGGLKSAEVKRSTASKNEAPLENFKHPQANEAVTVNVTVTDSVNVNETQTTALCFEILKFFNFTELRNPDKLFRCRAFLTRLGAEKIEHFKVQFEFYKKYKVASKEKTHSFFAFIEEGWDSQNWMHKFYELNKSTPSAGVYIPPKRSKVENNEEIAQVKSRYEYLKQNPPPAEKHTGFGSLIKKQLDKISPKP